MEGSTRVEVARMGDSAFTPRTRCRRAGCIQRCLSGSGGGGWIPLVTRGWPPTSYARVGSDVYGQGIGAREVPRSSNCSTSHQGQAIIDQAGTGKAINFHDLSAARHLIDHFGLNCADVDDWRVKVDRPLP